MINDMIKEGWPFFGIFQIPPGQGSVTDFWRSKRLKEGFKMVKVEKLGQSKRCLMDSLLAPQNRQGSFF